MVYSGIDTLTIRKICFHGYINVVVICEDHWDSKANTDNGVKKTTHCVKSNH